MKANELRIGNWILIPYQNAPVAMPVHETQVQGISIFGEILSDNTIEHEGLKTHYNHVDPIPLTEEWLIKFGFEKKNKSFHIIVNRVYYTVIEQRRNGFVFKGALMRYVHQLQNLLFALSNEEIEIRNK